ncbi:TetR family transcriptional regulator [Collinsella sp. An2]|uniref:TetR family transcriptional regulator n=1 Tax=Collinsella sp. An2 TaxID=1965585 RepID=UPI0013026DBB|nr:TetR family transcriptional regulator [Collinsella sp. An2]
MTSPHTTEEKLTRSLALLLEKKPFEKITVAELVSTSNIAKRTFYYHFKDKYDLAPWFYVHELDEFFEAHDTYTFEEFLAHSVEVVWKDRSVLKSIVRYTGQNNVPDALLEPLLERYLSVITQVTHAAVPERIIRLTRFFVGGTITYAVEEVSKEQPESPAAAIPFLLACLPAELKTYLGI